MAVITQPAAGAAAQSQAGRATLCTLHGNPGNFQLIDGFTCTDAAAAVADTPASLSGQHASLTNRRSPEEVIYK
jgi:hypothetical protein